MVYEYERAKKSQQWQSDQSRQSIVKVMISLVNMLQSFLYFQACQSRSDTNQLFFSRSHAKKIRETEEKTFFTRISQFLVYDNIDKWWHNFLSYYLSFLIRSIMHMARGVTATACLSTVFLCIYIGEARGSVWKCKIWPKCQMK